MLDYTKPPLSVEQQIELIEKRRLQIPERKAAARLLSTVSYYGTVPFSPEKKLPSHFYAHKKIDPMHISKDTGKISEEIIQHLTSLINSQVTITLDIDATVPEGFTDEKRRVLSENCAVLKFVDSGFGE